MNVFTLSYSINDEKIFKEEVLTKVYDSFHKNDESKPYTVFAVSSRDEFARIEKIEDILNSLSMDDREKIEAIEAAISQ